MSSSKWKKSLGIPLRALDDSFIPTDFVMSFLWVYFKHNVNYIIVVSM